MPGDYADDIRSAMTEVASRESPADSSVVDVQSREVSSPEPASRELSRDESGKFSPRTPAKLQENDDGLGNSETANEEVVEQGQQAAPADKQPVDQQKQPTQLPANLRPPASWTPEARETWSKLDPVAQREVYRREREITETLRTTAEARNFYSEAGRIIGPYMPMIQAEGSNPIQAMDNLFRTAATLRTGTPQVKASLVADLIMQYGVDIEALDSAIVAKRGGQPSPQGSQQPDIGALIDQRLRPVLEQLNPIISNTRQAEQETTHRLQTETEQFMNDERNEFAWDLKDDMADILDMASRRGIKISLQDAYQRAIMLHPTISGIVQSRKGQPRGETEAARRARLAAASLSNDGAPGREGEDGDDDSVRAAILASARAVGARR